jgi:hypothetical protein
VSHQAPLPARRVRIGDAERDEAVSMLSEHFVAGRLTHDEFEERSNKATVARYADDLAPLFDDLPDPAAASMRGPRAWSPGSRPTPPPLIWLMPVLMVGLVVTAVVLAAPWILWMLFWVALFAGPWRRRRHHYYSRYQSRSQSRHHHRYYL